DPRPGWRGGSAGPYWYAGRRTSCGDHPALRPDASAAGAVGERLAAFPAVDVDTAAAVVQLLQRPPLRRDVQGALDPVRGAGRDHADALLLLLGDAPARARGALDAGEEPEGCVGGGAVAGPAPAAGVDAVGVRQLLLTLPFGGRDPGLPQAPVVRLAGGGDGDRCALRSVGDVVGAGDQGGL